MALFSASVMKPGSPAFRSLPAASRLNAISPMPLALSAIGPNTSMLIVSPVSVSIPMPVIATPNAMYSRFCASSHTATAPRIAAEMMSAAHTELSRPSARPEMMLVACPVRLARTTSCTGLYSVLVQYSVHLLSATARTMPMRQHHATDRLMPGLSGTWYRACDSSSGVTTNRVSPVRSTPRAFRRVNSSGVRSISVNARSATFARCSSDSLRHAASAFVRYPSSASSSLAAFAPFRSGPLRSSRSSFTCSVTPAGGCSSPTAVRSTGWSYSSWYMPLSMPRSTMYAASNFRYTMPNSMKPMVLMTALR